MTLQFGKVGTAHHLRLEEVGGAHPSRLAIDSPTPTWACYPAARRPPSFAVEFGRRSSSTTTQGQFTRCQV
jgi:hypothetical protein